MVISGIVIDLKVSKGVAMWTEKYKPGNLADVVGLDQLVAMIKKYAEGGDIPHFLFYGKQGTGKTLLAELIGKTLLGDYTDGNFIKVNASDDRSIIKIRNLVLTAIKHATINGNLRIILLDECDGLLLDAQEILRGAMDKSIKTRFILTCNDVSKVIVPLQDRFIRFEFKGVKAKDIIKRLAFIVEKEQLEVSGDMLEKIAKKSGGSVRSAILELEKLVMSGLDCDEDFFERLNGK
jgi:DNA polymerase III delta prime subunit